MKQIHGLTKNLSQYNYYLKRLRTLQIFFLFKLYTNMKKIGIRTIKNNKVKIKCKKNKFCLGDIKFKITMLTSLGPDATLLLSYDLPTEKLFFFMFDIH